MVIGLLGLAASGCSAAQDRASLIREPAVAGAFYPGTASELSSTVSAFLQQAPTKNLSGEVVALLVPHAGYAFSGAIAGVGFKAVVGRKLDTVYVIGTSHYAAGSGAFAWSGSAWRTPLGDVPVDRAAVQELARTCRSIRIAPEVWTREHSVEVEVPFLQQVAPDAKLVPLVMGPSSEEECQDVARAIVAQAAQRQALLVASSDLTHYPNWADARRVDQAMLAAALKLDTAGLDQLDRAFMSQGIPQLACTVCGLSALKTVIIAARELGAKNGELLAAANSGDVSGDRTRVVGYAAVAFVRPKNAGAAKPPVASELERSQQELLLDRARAAIAKKNPALAAAAPLAGQPWAESPRAVFVTLTQNGNLRGCIGQTVAQLPLLQAVPQMACAAAFEDPRFPPLTAEELPRTTIEISILSPLQKIRSAQEIVMGKHGVVVRAQGHMGLFLPQVAAETGWSKEEFLDELCSQKAFLPARAWQDPDTELYVFTVQSFRQPAPGNARTPAR
jgi:AmmeMemoRadiSam system protein B/AmmeMemoRadiSam system protein A